MRATTSDSRAAPPLERNPVVRPPRATGVPGAWAHGPPHDDPVGPHPQRVPNQLPDRHLAAAFEVGRPRLQPHHVALAQPQLGRVLDRHDPLLPGDRA